MLSGQKLKQVRLVLWILLIAILLIIFLFSAQKGEDSGDTSGRIAQMVLRVIRPNYAQLPQKEQEELLHKTNLIVRKCAHFTEYAALALVLYLLLRTYPLRMRALLSWLGATIYAVTDEIHQLFVGERMGSTKDVLIDSCGAAAGVLIAFMLVQWKLKKRAKV